VVKDFADLVTPIPKKSYHLPGPSPMTPNRAARACPCQWLSTALVAGSIRGERGEDRYSQRRKSYAKQRSSNSQFFKVGQGEFVRRVRKITTPQTTHGCFLNLSTRSRSLVVAWADNISTMPWMLGEATSGPLSDSTTTSSEIPSRRCDFVKNRELHRNSIIRR